MNRITFDSRWVGDHGIGRFAREMESRLPGLTPYRGMVKPSNPLDVFLISLAIARHPRSNWYSPGYNAPLWGLDRYVFTVMDLNHLDIPENSSRLKRLYYQLVMKRACRSAARVLTISEYSRQRILTWTRAPQEQVINVGTGVSAAFSPAVKPLTPGYEYLLCVGNRKFHKNEARLIKAFAAAQIDPRIRLLLSGQPSRELDTLVVGLKLSERVSFTGRLTESELASHYAGALALAFPSLYEGFGLPVIEAMACGTPVITSTTTSLPEVAGDAALLVDPLSEAEIAAAIERMVVDVNLRHELSKRGFERARIYTWDAVAARVRSAIDLAFSPRAAKL
jgi:glycosyltransferase involved in cell wall biosynthesis